MTILSTNSLNRAISSPSSMLASVKNYETSSDIKIVIGILSVATIGVAYGIFALYTHIHSIQKQRVFAAVASGIAHANIHDIKRGQLKIPTDQGTILFKQVTGIGKPKVQISINTDSGRVVDYLPDISSLQELQNRMIVDMLKNHDAYNDLGVVYQPTKPAITTPLTFNNITRHRIQDEEAAKGGNLSQVKKITYKNNDVYFFKPMQTGNDYITAALFSGIADNDNRYADRSMFTYVLSEVLGLGVVPKTGLSFDSLGKAGYIQEKAPGLAGEMCLKILHNKDELDLLLTNNKIIRQMIEIQLLDALTGQVDRHMNNYFIDLASHKVTCIDNDAAFGHLATHPHTMIPTKRNDGYEPDYLTDHEINTINHLQHNSVDEPIRALKKHPDTGRAVFLPPVMDKTMINRYKNLCNAELMSYMSQFNFTPLEMAAACSRLKAIQFHIQVLEKRQAKGVHSIINPSEWNSQKTLKRLFPQDGNKVGNALSTFTSYLARDMAAIRKRIKQYKPPAYPS